MNFLALDISSKTTGWAVINEKQELIDCGEIELEKYKKRGYPLEYIKILYDGVSIIIKKYFPMVIFVENIYHFSAPTTKSLARVRGVCEIAALNNNVKGIKELDASHVRKVVLGNGGLKKEEVCSIMEERYKINLKTRGFDKSDALLVALCGVIEYGRPTISTKKKRRNKLGKSRTSIGSNEFGKKT